MLKYSWLFIKFFWTYLLYFKRQMNCFKAFTHAFFLAMFLVKAEKKKEQFLKDLIQDPAFQELFKKDVQKQQKKR